MSLPALNFFFWSLHLAFHFDFGGTQKTCNALGKLNVLCTCKRRSQTNQNPSPRLSYISDRSAAAAVAAGSAVAFGWRRMTEKKNQFLLLQPLQLPLAAYHTYPYAGAQCVDAGLALVPLYLARHILADRRAVT